MKITPTDGYGRAAILGNNNGTATPIKVATNGSLFTVNKKYELVKALKLDLSISRDKELYQVSFDSFAIPNLDGEIDIYIDSPNEDKKLEINSCLSIDISANKIYISNKAQEAFADMWFFKIKEVI